MMFIYDGLGTKISVDQVHETVINLEGYVKLTELNVPGIVPVKKVRNRWYLAHDIEVSQETHKEIALFSQRTCEEKGNHPMPVTQLNDQCFWPNTTCPKCNEQYCEKCGIHVCPERIVNRQLFIRLMRNPEMSILRHALLHLKYDRDMDWREINELDVSCDPLNPHGSSWRLTTDKFQVYTLWAGHPDLDHDHFHFDWYHDPNADNCPCEDCKEDREINDEYCWMHSNQTGEGGWTSKIRKEVNKA